MAPAEEKEAEEMMRHRKKHETQDHICKGDNGGVGDNLKEWNRHIEEVKQELVENISSHLRDLLDKAVTEAVQSYRGEVTTKQEALQPNKKHRKSAPVTEKQKVFLQRESLLDELMEVEHLRTIYHMFVAVLCVLLITNAVVDIIDQGRLVVEFNLLFYTFGQFNIVVCAWMCLFVYTLVVPYQILHLWGSLYPKSKHPYILSALAGGVMLLCQICVLGVFPVFVVKRYRLPPSSSFIVTLEQVRFVMKSYSFLRESAPLILLKQKQEVPLPKFSSYLYYLFCPTLIYRDSYPRTPYIRWKYVAKYFAQFVGCVYFMYVVVVTLCIPAFSNMSKEPYSTKTLVLSIFHATLPGILVLLLSFFALLHCWLNAFAEMLRFADRMFYKDWWNSTSFSKYYRTWNVVVHDWLYRYIYQDLLWLCKQRFRAGVTLAVFFISASVHEYVLIVALGFFYPVLFCQFAILGVLFNFIMNDKRTNPMWNVMFWTFLSIGQGIQLCLYLHEWYAQIHCPLTENTFWGMVTPRSWSCPL
ncbi:sterol O-acyltransferase 2 [Discoglossus pictus]